MQKGVVFKDKTRISEKVFLKHEIHLFFFGWDFPSPQSDAGEQLNARPDSAETAAGTGTGIGAAGVAPFDAANTPIRPIHTRCNRIIHKNNTE